MIPKVLERFHCIFNYLKNTQFNQLTEFIVSNIFVMSFNLIKYLKKYCEVWYYL